MARRLISSGSTFEKSIGYSRAVVDGDWVFVSGTTGFDYSNMTIQDDAVAQCEQALKNIAAALKQADSSLRRRGSRALPHDQCRGLRTLLAGHGQGVRRGAPGGHHDGGRARGPAHEDRNRSHRPDSQEDGAAQEEGQSRATQEGQGSVVETAVPRSRTMSADYEKLGAFYLGREFDPAANALKDDLVLYDSKDLTTHAVCVGMTGSGKTGLCLSLLEEAAIDGVPAICIDPKGDLGNLMLTFPNLAPARLRALGGRGRCRAQGCQRADSRQDRGDLENGLAEWDQAPERIGKLRAAADVAIYTPGAETGLPLSVLRSFSPPSPELLADAGALRDRIGSVVSGLLSLLEHRGGPHRFARAHPARQHPRRRVARGAVARHDRPHPGRAEAGLRQAGRVRPRNVFPRERPPQARDADQQPHRLAGLRHVDAGRATRRAAAAVHARGQAAHLDHLHRASQRCRAHVHRHAGAQRSHRVDAQSVGHRHPCAPFSTWTRSSGSFRPPRIRRPNNPCSRCSSRRARSVWACVLATQNPVDLDYKGLANCGTWFIGRLQTERDKLRVIEGLKSALAGARRRRGSRSADVEPHAARVPHAQRARRRAGAHENALGAVLSARPAHGAGDCARDERAQERERAAALRTSYPAAAPRRTQRVPHRVRRSAPASPNIS